MITATGGISVAAPATATAGATVGATVTGFSGPAGDVDVRVLFNGEELNATVEAAEGAVRVKIKIPAEARSGSIIIIAADSAGQASSVTFV